MERRMGMLVVTVVLSACVEESSTFEGKCPPFEDFTQVSRVLEARCGTLDCHGSGARPLKIYGQNGLRAATDVVDPNLYPGGPTATTDVELALNYRSICALEPEIMTEVVSGASSPSELTLVRKPRLTEKHKGGRIWDQGKPGDRCLVNWLKANEYTKGTYDPASCNEELAR